MLHASLSVAWTTDLPSGTRSTFISRVPAARAPYVPIRLKLKSLLAFHFPEATIVFGTGDVSMTRLKRPPPSTSESSILPSPLNRTMYLTPPTMAVRLLDTNRNPTRRLAAGADAARLTGTDRKRIGGLAAEADIIR